MTSKTGFPRSPSIYVFDVKINDSIRKELLSDLGWDVEKQDAAVQASMFDELELILKHQFHREFSASERPMPANIKAVLKKILPHAEGLASLLKDQAVISQVQKYLGGADIGRLWNDLTKLAVNASVAIE